MRRRTSSPEVETSSTAFRHRSPRQPLYQRRTATARKSSRTGAGAGRRLGNPSESQHESSDPQQQQLITFIIPTAFHRSVTSRWILRVSVEALWQHLVYSRQLWSMPYHQVLKYNQHQQQNSKSNNPRFLRIIQSRKQQLQELTDQWRLVLQNTNIRQVALLLGPSPHRAREVYFVDPRLLLHEDAPSPMSSTTTPDKFSAKQQYTLSTRLVREWVVQHEADLSLPSRKDRLFVACGIAVDSYDVWYARAMLLQSSDSLPPHRTHHPPPLHHSVVLRREWSQWNAPILSQRRRPRYSTVQLVPQEESESAVDDAGKDTQEELVWLTLRTSLQGLDMPRPNHNADCR